MASDFETKLAAIILEQIHKCIDDRLEPFEHLPRAVEGLAAAIGDLKIDNRNLFRRTEGFPVAPLDEKDYEDWEN
jgi:hypothetical protein